MRRDLQHKHALSGHVNQLCCIVSCLQRHVLLVLCCGASCLSPTVSLLLAFLKPKKSPAGEAAAGQPIGRFCKPEAELSVAC